jgi:hypothetical protein
MADGTKSTDSALSVSQGIEALLGPGSGEAANPEPEEQEAEEEASEAETYEPDTEAETEGEGEEVEAEQSDDAEEPEDDSEEEPDDESSEYVTVTVDGEDQQVTLDELRKGYQRQSDYTRKTQQVAEERKAAEQERQNVQQERQQLYQRLQEVEHALGQQGQEPDWERLWQEDPDEYNRQRWAWQDRKERLEQARQERQRLQRQQQEEAQRQFQQRVQQEHQRLLNRLPHWQDENTAKQEKPAVMTYAKQLGFSDEELQQVADSRAVEALYKAMKYDELQAKKPAAKKKASKAPKMAKSGQPKSRSDRRSDEVKKHYSRLAKTGSKDAAVDYLLSRNKR